MVARTLGVPIALFSLVDDHRQFFKSAFGLAEPWASRRGTPLSHAFCQHVVARDAPFSVEDVDTHEVVAANPAMRELGIAAYLGVPVRDRDGQVLGALCAVDIEPHPWSDEAVAVLADFAALVEGEIDLRAEVTRRREAEEMLHLAAAATGLGLWWLNGADGDLTCTAACRTMVGLDGEGVIPTAVWRGHIHPDDRDEAARKVRAAFDPAGDGRLQHEYRMLKPDGEVVWISSIGRIDGQPNVGSRTPRLVGTVQDITQRKRTEEMLAHNERRWREILNTMPQMVWSAQPDGRYDFFNDRWYEFTGFPRGMVDGEMRRAVLHPDDAERGWSCWQHALATGEPYDIEYRLRRFDGEYRWTLGRALPLRNEAGEIERWLGTSTDIHDRKMAEEQRELISRELSHRIKNIFAVVNSLVTLSARVDPQARPFADAVRARIEALAQAHDYVRPPRGAAGQPGRQSVLGLLETLLVAYRENGRSHITLSGHDVSTGVHAATALALLVHELATNAVKYGALSTPDGTVTLTCTDTADSYNIVWQERGGPPVEGPPTRKGFGTLMSERAAAAQLGADITHAWAREGLTVEITVPHGRLEH
ncbi:histidine kinase/response regulator hybrid protein [Blastochloris viridis]|nr:histidine kinase/response regulator hybrid protein [Blastochloris viridis]